MIDFLSFYNDNAAAYQQQINITKRHLFYIAMARLASFIILTSLLYFFFHFHNGLYVLLSLLTLAVFLWLVKISAGLNERKLLLENLFFVNNNEAEILEGEPNAFDNGIAQQTGDSYYADLDIFGEDSLFHLLNRTSTGYGTDALASLLKNSFTSSAAVIEYQDAIKTLSPQHDIREQVIAQACMHKENAENMSDVEAWIKEPSVLLNNKWLGIIRYLLPLINLVMVWVFLDTGSYTWLLVTVVISWIIVLKYRSYINREHLLLGKKQYILTQYAAILKEFEKTDPGNAGLLKKQRQYASEAHGEIRKLSGLTNLLDQRLNLVVNFLLNSLLIYEVQCAMALEKWKVNNSQHFPEWIGCVSTIECITSLATFAFNHPSYCYPQLSDSGLVIEATAMAHPLIREEERISNDLTLGTSGKLSLITGSNMSGKTTFLRTVGVNTLLAQCGAPVCAQSFTLTPVHIYSSIRISDSLQEHTSYFMAELKRLSEIKKSIASQQPSLVLIDEILRGTNSEDKYYGSAQFVQQLIQFNCLTLFATHDLKLSELEDKYPGVVENYCFESIIENGELIFDYRILKGVAKNKNASFLMKKMEII